MDFLLRSNIKKSMDLAEKGELAEAVDRLLPRELITTLKGSKPADAIPSILERARPIPWFYRDEDGQLRSPHESCFGLYALRDLIRGILMGTRFIQAGDHLTRGGYFAVAVTCLYSASFQLLSSYLAVNRRVVIEKAHPNPFEEQCSSSTTLVGGQIPQCVVATLENENRWVFSKQSRSHAARWRLVQEILETEQADQELLGGYPEFLGFFYDLLTYGPYTPPEDRDYLIAEGIKTLLKMRHESVYRGIGDDDFAADQISNGHPAAGLDRKVQLFRRFAIQLLAFAFDEAFRIMQWEDWRNWPEARGALLMAVMTPPFENPLPEGNEDLDQKIRSLMEWLINKPLPDSCDTQG